MGAVITRPTELLVVLAREKLALSQEQFAKAIGSSVRTVSRFEGGQSTPADFHFHAIAKLVHPVASDLAAEAAARGGKTLPQLGIVGGQASPEPLPASLLIDAVVCAVISAIETSQGAPVSVKSARAAAAAAFTSARALRLGLDEAAAALGQHEPGGEAQRARGAARAAK